MTPNVKLRKNMQPKHGGKRKGAERPKSAPYSVHPINVDTELLKELKKLYGVKELNSKIRLFMASLRCV